MTTFHQLRVVHSSVERQGVTRLSIDRACSSRAPSTSNPTLQSLGRRSIFLAPVALGLVSLSAEASESGDRAQQIAQDYNSYASQYDNLDGGGAAEALGFLEQRKALLAEASGSWTVPREKKKKTDLT